jgi:hypothetical protein
MQAEGRIVEQMRQCSGEIAKNLRYMYVIPSFGSDSLAMTAFNFEPKRADCWQPTELTDPNHQVFTPARRYRSMPASKTD